MKDNYIVQAWLILTLAVCFGAALSGIELALADKIEQNKVDETYSQIPNIVRAHWWMPQSAQWAADATKTRECVTPQGHLAYKAFDKDDNHVGWVIKATGQGFADKIELLIGLDPEGETILGLYVLNQKETPALGDRIREEGWRRHVIRRDASREITVSKASEKSGNESGSMNTVQAVTGATVSSRSVVAIVNAAVKDFRARIGELKVKP